MPQTQDRPTTQARIRKPPGVLAASHPQLSCCVVRSTCAATVLSPRLLAALTWVFHKQPHGGLVLQQRPSQLQVRVGCSVRVVLH